MKLKIEPHSHKKTICAKPCDDNKNRFWKDAKLVCASTKNPPVTTFGGPVTGDFRGPESSSCPE